MLVAAHSFLTGKYIMVCRDEVNYLLLVIEIRMTLVSGLPVVM